MKPGFIENAKRILGAQQGYIGLPIRDIEVNCSVNGEGTPAMQSIHYPSAEEVMALMGGAPLILTVLGVRHPPVMIEVGEQPE